MSKILVMEDLDNSYTLIKGALESEHKLIRARTVEDGKNFLDQSVDLAIVDISLPDGDGYEFCDWVRMKLGNHDLPIIFLTAKTSLDSRVTAYSVGGDDFLSKPFNILELRVRVNSKLQRAIKRSKVLVEKSGIQINYREQTVKMRIDSGEQKTLDITPIEFKILSMLMSDPEKAFSRDELLNEVWGKDIYVYPRSVDTHVSKLRKKMEHKSDLIRSVHGMGYKFTEQEDNIQNAI